jgi:hypothetical protein
MKAAQEACLGLDIGTSRIVLARRVQNNIEYHTELNAFVRIPFSRMTESVFRKEGVPHSVENEEILVYGNEAEKFANLFHVETRRPMSKGLLNPEEPEGPAVLARIVAHLAGKAGAESGKLCFSLPGAPPEGGDALKFHESVVRQVLGEFPFHLSTINEGLAVVYGEMEDSNYTGVGVSCGGGTCNVCLSYLSTPIIMFAVEQAGDFIDAGAAAATGEMATRIRVYKEQGFHLNGASSDKIQHALTVYYDEAIRNLVEAMARAFTAGTRGLSRLERPAPLVLSGGTALPPGFRERFEVALRATDFPLPVSAIRLAADPLHSTAKGALLSALAE